jgi:hypothetical protein
MIASIDDYRGAYGVEAICRVPPIVAHGRSGMAKRELRLITISWKRGFGRYARRARQQLYR